jgi:hypothetical protein
MQRAGREQVEPVPLGRHGLHVAARVERDAACRRRVRVGSEGGDVCTLLEPEEDAGTRCRVDDVVALLLRVGEAELRGGVLRGRVALEREMPATTVSR